MQNESWMQPALQTSEAVLLPALERQSMVFPRFGNRFLSTPAPTSVFQPANEPWEERQPLALSTYVRPRGSMAGRSVLRAAGIRTEPMYRRAYCSPSFRTASRRRR